MTEVESVIFEASVVDDFTRELERLSDKLEEIAVKAEGVDEIDIDADVASALAGIEVVEQRLNSLDRKQVEPEVEVDWDMADDHKMWQLFGLQDHDTGGEGLFNYDSGLKDAVESHGTAFGTPEPFGFNRGDDSDSLGIPGQFGSLMDMSLGNVMGDGERHDRSPIMDVIKRFGKLKLTMGFFMNLLASIIPLLGVFVGALPAAIAGIAALGAAALATAGALAGVGGMAILGMAFQGGQFNVEELRQEMRQLLEVFKQSFLPMAEALEPLAEDAFTNMATLLRDVGTQTRRLFQITDDARAAMDFLTATIPTVVGQMIEFADVLGPILGGLLQPLFNIDFVAVFAEILAQVGPLIVFIASAIGRALPAVYQLSRGFLAVATALIMLFSRAFQLINLIPGLATGLGVLISLMFVAATATALYSIATSGLVETFFALIFDAIPAAITRIHAWIAAQTSAAIATATLTVITATLLGLLTLGIIPAVASLTTGFGALDSNIQSATGSLKDFARTSRRVGGLGGIGAPTYGGSGQPAYTSPTQNVQVVANDKETGTAVGNTIAFTGSTTVPPGDTDNEKHSG